MVRGEILSNMNPKRNEFIDNLKGLAILFMVIGHSGCPELMFYYIYLFHMPLFFFISGYLFKDNYIDTPLKFVARKLKSCYIPFVKYSLFFLLIHELLVPLGFTEHYTLSNYVRQLFLIVSFSGTEVFLGPYWFLIYLFFASVIFIAFTMVAQWIFTRYVTDIRTRTYASMSAVIVLSALCIIVIDVFNLHIPKLTIATFMAVIYHGFGHIWKVTNKNVHILTAVVCLGLLLFVVVFLPMCRYDGMHVATTRDFFLYSLLSFVGIAGIWGLVNKVTNKYLTKILSFLGKNSMGIMTFHFLGQAIMLNVLQIASATNLPLFQWPITESKWWFVIVGGAVLLSLAFIWVENTLKLNERFLKKLYICRNHQN